MLALLRCRGLHELAQSEQSLWMFRKQMITWLFMSTAPHMLGTEGMRHPSCSRHLQHAVYKDLSQSSFLLKKNLAYHLLKIFYMQFWFDAR